MGETKLVMLIGEASESNRAMTRDESRVGGGGGGD